MTEAVGLLTEHAFSQLGLARVEALVFAHNPASRRVLEKGICGLRAAEKRRRSGHRAAGPDRGPW